MKLPLLLLSILFSSPLFAQTEAIEATGPGYHFKSWDADVDGGLFVAPGSPWGGRLRVGVIRAVDDNFYALGASLGHYGPFGFVAGAEAEWTSLQSGIWAQVAALTASEVSTPVLKAAVGFSLVGFDLFWQPRASENTWMGLIKLRIPLRLIALAVGSSDKT